MCAWLRLAAACAAIAATAGFAPAAGAATLQLEPLSIRLTPTTRAAVLHLRNGGEQPVQVQLRAYRWDQAGGDDRLQPTQDLRVSPPIQAIPPGGEQLVRVILAEGLGAESELTYRLLVDELPQAPADDGHVHLLLRYSLPVTLRPAGLAPPALRFRLLQEPDGSVLVAENDGGRSAQLADLRLATQGGDSITISDGLFGYVLAGQVRRWPLHLPGGTRIEDATRVQATIDGRAEDHALEVAH